MNDTQWVINYFVSAAREWPCPAFAESFLYVPVSDDPEVTERCRMVLSRTEMERANRFVTASDRDNFIQRRAFRMHCAACATGEYFGGSPFAQTANGRPYLSQYPGLWFSFASCRAGFVGAWSATHAIGVDLEDSSVAIEASIMAGHYFTPAEARVVSNAAAERHKIFLQLWSLKEAALKSIGEGLPFGMDKFGFEINATVRVTDAPESHGGPDNFMPHIFDLPDLHASIVARSPAY